MNQYDAIDRRNMIASIAALIGAASLPAEALAAPRRRRAASANLLTPLQFACFTAIADTVIPVTDTPGAVAAGVPRVFDGLLRNWASPAHRTQLLGEIAAIDQMAMDADKKPFAQLTPERRKELLLGFDRDALKAGPPSTEKLNAFEAMMAGPSVVRPGWVRMKGLIINIYYNSEIACTQELIYEHVPGKWVPSMKATPETRPFASGGPF